MRTTGTRPSRFGAPLVLLWLCVPPTPASRLSYPLCGWIQLAQPSRRARGEGNCPRLNFMKSLFPCFKYPFFHRLFGSVTSEFLFLPPTTLKVPVLRGPHPAGFWDLPRAQPPWQEGKTRRDGGSRRTGLSVPVNTFLTCCL